MGKFTETARNILAGALARFGLEVFTEHATPWQEGFWIDREPGRFLCIGMGRRVLWIAPLVSVSAAP